MVDVWYGQRKLESMLWSRCIHELVLFVYECMRFHCCTSCKSFGLHCFEVDIDALLTVKIDLTAFGFKFRAFAFS